jgi:hypothetical protein
LSVNDGPDFTCGLTASAEGAKRSSASTAPAPKMPIRRRGTPVAGARCLPRVRCLP